MRLSVKPLLFNSFDVLVQLYPDRDAPIGPPSSFFSFIPPACLLRSFHD